MMLCVDLPAGHWLQALERPDPPGQPAVPEVTLEGYPVDLGWRYREHMAEMLRELRLIVVAAREARDEPPQVPQRLLALADELVERYAADMAHPAELLEKAVVDGTDRIDLRYPLLPESRTVLLEYARTMEEVDAFSWSESMITVAPDDRVYALRRWIVEEFVHQYDGRPPRRWPG